MMHKQTIGLGICAALFAMSAAAQVTTSGTTTANTVPVFSSSSAITNSPITVSGGNVGIGTTNPIAPLHVLANGSNSLITLDESNASYWMPLDFDNQGTSRGEIVVNNAGTGMYVAVGGTNSGFSSTRMSILSSGNVGIGTTSPGAPLEVNGSVKLTAGSGAAITFQDGTTQSTAFTGVLCGGDYAESVDVSGDRRNYAAGDVLVIDPNDSGKFLKSVKPYSTAVLGIYSTKPGAVGRRQLTSKSADEVPMAMIGIVPTKVSAENGAIKPGDLLVTSSTPGYAMKGTDRSRLVGAIIGKAMGRLDSGEGVIEVGVTLQ